MAILERLPGVSAVILVNGEEVTEHHDEDEISVEHENPAVVAHQKQRTVSTWIPAEDDAFFQIKVAVDPEYGMMNCSKLGFEIKVDGEFIWTSHCHRPRREDNEEYWEDVVSGVKKGKGLRCTERRFRFAKIETHANPAEKAALKRLKQR